jgi:ubiquinone/menaquinone biosynthesis C-methylase UbiE
MNIFVCPNCKHSLDKNTNQYYCKICTKEFLEMDGITDFLSNEGSQSSEMIDFFDEVSDVYETLNYYANLYTIYGGLQVNPVKITVPLINNIFKSSITDMIQSKGKRILDVACGTGMYTRHIAKYARQVYGVDISWGMLKKAQKTVKLKELENITFSRAQVENLPFKDNYFDAVSCCGALQLFPDVNKALEEMHRVLKVRGKLAVMTYLKRSKKSLRGLKPPLEFLENEKQIHFFTIGELKSYLWSNGYNNINHQKYGSIVLFEGGKI